MKMKKIQKELLIKMREKFEKLFRECVEFQQNKQSNSAMTKTKLYDKCLMISLCNLSTNVITVEN